MRNTSLASLLFLLLPVALHAQADELKIIVIEGDNAVNNIRRGVTTKPVVEVRDQNDRPVAGVILTFSSPRSGAGGVFANGSNFETIATDSNGRASVTFQPNSVAGTYDIVIAASHNGRTARAAIRQQNVAPAAAISAKTVGLLAAVGAAAAVGIAVGLGGKSSGSPSAPTAPPVAALPTIRIGVGSGAVVEPRP